MFLNYSSGAEDEIVNHKINEHKYVKLDLIISFLEALESKICNLELPQRYQFHIPETISHKVKMKNQKRKGKRNNKHISYSLPLQFQAQNLCLGPRCQSLESNSANCSSETLTSTHAPTEAASLAAN